MLDFLIILFPNDFKTINKGSLAYVLHLMHTGEGRGRHS